MPKLSIFVKLSAKQEKVWFDAILQTVVVAVNAKPVDGKANDAVVRLICKKLGLGPTKVTIVSGHTARHKKLQIDGELSEEQILEKLKNET